MAKECQESGRMEFLSELAKLENCLSRACQHLGPSMTSCSDTSSQEETAPCHLLLKSEQIEPPVLRVAVQVSSVSSQSSDLCRGCSKTVSSSAR